MYKYYLGPDGNLYTEEELKHYGVRGMKWGVRRYQNADGTLTAAGRKRAKAEYKEDNAEAFKLGRDASITGAALYRSEKRTKSLEKKRDSQLENDPDQLSNKTQRINRKLMASRNTTQYLQETYDKNRAAAEEHCKSLVDKYGAQAVKSINYSSKTGKVSERTNTMSDYAKAGARSVAESAVFSLLLGLPVSVISVPKGASGKGASLERSLYALNREQIGNTRVEYEIIDGSKR